MQLVSRPVFTSIWQPCINMFVKLMENNPGLSYDLKLTAEYTSVCCKYMQRIKENDELRTLCRK